MDAKAAENGRANEAAGGVGVGGSSRMWLRLERRFVCAALLWFGYSRHPVSFHQRCPPPASNPTPPPAMRQVAILCNHQRAVPRAHDNQMEKMKEKLAALQEEIEVRTFGAAFPAAVPAAPAAVAGRWKEGGGRNSAAGDWGKVSLRLVSERANRQPLLAMPPNSAHPPPHTHTCTHLKQQELHQELGMAQKGKPGKDGSAPSTCPH